MAHLTPPELVFLIRVVLLWLLNVRPLILLCSTRIGKEGRPFIMEAILCTRMGPVQFLSKHIFSNNFHRLGSWRVATVRTSRIQ